MHDFLNALDMKHALLFLLLIFIYFSCQNTSSENSEVGNEDSATSKALSDTAFLDVVSFGSCNFHDAKQDLWKPVVDNGADLWIWLGDIVYADTENMAKMSKFYDAQKNHPAYSRFLTFCPVLGTWDDHDYGVNDGGVGYPKKQESKELLFDFLEVPESSPANTRDGVYQSYSMGPTGKKVKVIILDTRWFRDDIELNEGAYLPNTSGTILGEAQWEWLESELKNSDAQVHIIASSIQVVARDHRFEKWANFPNERTKLIRMLRELRPPNVVFISGDRHIGEISKDLSMGVDYPIYDITSSGLTHSYESVGNEPNRHRIGEITGKRNFGTLKIDWDSDPIKITAELRGEENSLILSHELDFTAGKYQ